MITIRGEDEMERICLFCKNFRMSQFQPGYSDVTPGQDFEIYCDRDYWKLDQSQDGVTDYRHYQLMAQTCKDFEQVDLEALGVKNG